MTSLHLFASVGRAFTSLTLVTLLLTGCGAAETAFDCQSVCSKYSECYNKDYDVGACRERCRSDAAKDPTIREVADACEMCIYDKSCLSTTFICGPSCVGIRF